MSPHDRRRVWIAVAALAVAVAASTAACGAVVPASPTETMEPVRTQVVTIPVPTRDKAASGAAADVLSARLRTIGIDTFSVDVGGDHMTFQLVVPVHVDPASIGAVLHQAGVVTFVPWPSGRDNVPEPGVPAPADLVPLFAAGTGVASATVGSDQAGKPTADIRLADAAARSFATWTTANVGEYLLVVMDGTVATNPIVMEPITDGVVQLSFSPPSPMTAEALVAILASGPLPEPWREGPSPSPVPSPSPGPSPSPLPSL